MAKRSQNKKKIEKIQKKMEQQANSWVGLKTDGTFFAQNFAFFLSKTANVTFGRKPVFSTKPVSIFPF